MGQLDLLRTKEELFISDRVLVPSTKKNRLTTVNDALLPSKNIDCVWPELSNKLYNRMGTIDNAAMGPVIDCKLECSRFFN